MNDQQRELCLRSVQAAHSRCRSQKKKIDQLVGEKQELEAKIDEAKVAFEENKLYKKEIDTLRESIENECEASGIMEIMNMRIEDAENKAREQELLKVMAEKEMEKEIKEKKVLHEKINDLFDVLSNKGYSTCDVCCDWKLIDSEMVWVNTERSEVVLVCMKCRDANHTQCNECMEFYENSYIVTMPDNRKVCSACSED